MRGSYTRLLAAKAILVYCVATAVGVLTGAYFIPAGALDRQSKLGGKQITSSTGFGIVQDDVDAQCSVCELTRLTDHECNSIHLCTERHETFNITSNFCRDPLYSVSLLC